MKSISVGELSRNLSAVIAEVEAGEVYELTRHHHRVGYIVPAVSSTQIIPRAVEGGAEASSIARHELGTAGAVEELINSDKGEW
ncbi:type II toxin-antitoxin system Phd/YefM family antitoxin [Nocardia sp. NPDC051750]|uniref:type II toxin-antitoxin system Phd/YefM family antitoxin n=1 Tax=Nocardia sp. NPDC051750 TaxID=3364325 RepID=UPI0037A32CF3